jgi:hypothetical protein
MFKVSNGIVSEVPSAFSRQLVRKVEGRLMPRAWDEEKILTSKNYRQRRTRISDDFPRAGFK